MNQAPPSRLRSARLGRPLLIGLAAILGIAVLKLGAPVIMPVVAALMIVLVLAPLDTRLTGRFSERWEWVGHIGTLGLLLVVMLAFLGGLAFCAQHLSQEYEEVSSALTGVIEETVAEETGAAAPAEGDARGGADTAARGGAQPGDADGAASGGEAAAAQGGEDSGTGSEAGQGSGQPASEAGLLQRLGGGLADAATAAATAVASGMAQMIAGFVVVYFLVLLAFSERRLWVAKFDRLVPASWHAPVRSILSTASRRLRIYLAVRTGVGLLNAALYVAWLALFGIDLLPVWAILTFLLNFIPNLGSIISAALPFLYAFVTLDPGMALLAGLGLFVIEQVVGNYLDPKLQGRQIALSALVILVSLVLFYWLWGVAGALLAVPVTMIVNVACAHFPATRGVALALSDQSDDAGLHTAMKG
ncbi:AI-2E family transporter [Roseivivax sp. CAU 1761]